MLSTWKVTAKLFSKIVFLTASLPDNPQVHGLIGLKPRLVRVSVLYKLSSLLGGQKMAEMTKTQSIPP
jgi:hypothetical protein